MIKIELSFATPEEAAAFLLARSGEHDEHHVEPIAGETPEQTAERKKRVRRTKAQIAADEAAAAAAAGQGAQSATPAATPAAPATPAATPGAVTARDAEVARAASVANVVDFMGGAAAVAAKPAITPEERLRRLVGEVRPAIQVVVDKKGPDTARDVVTAFGVTNLDQIPAERYDEFVQACRAAAA